MGKELEECFVDRGIAVREPTIAIIQHRPDIAKVAVVCPTHEFRSESEQIVQLSWVYPDCLGDGYYKSDRAAG